MKKTMLCVLVLMALSACSSEKQTVLKSPCVGTEGSPCGPLRHINDGWLKEKGRA